MKKVALILSGCGQHDGSETHETVATLLALDKHGIEWKAFAPNITQKDVINHLDNQPIDGEIRNALVESARLVRGKVEDIKNAIASNFDACIVPGGAGAIKTLCDFNIKGKNFNIQEDVLSLIKDFTKQNKAVGFICIAPVMISKIYPPKTSMTIGNDLELAKTLEDMGMNHEECKADDIVIDVKHKVVSTPANMVATNISEVFLGIEKLVHKIISFSG